MDPRAARIVDANLNRLAEGLRVIEDVCRLALGDRRLLASVRTLRERVGRETRALRRGVILHRASGSDPGRPARFDRGRRTGLEDVLVANLKRCEEAARTLEEVLKIDDAGLAARLKAVRFRLYAIEKRAVLAARRSAID
jgi:thiamine-phosphate pyrophosphorylase